MVVTTKMMRNATPLRPRQRPKRPAAEIARWRKARAAWMASLEPALLFQRLFDHIPGVYFFAKNKTGHLMFSSDGLLQRYQMPDDSEFIGRTDFDIMRSIAATASAPIPKCVRHHAAGVFAQDASTGGRALIGGDEPDGGRDRATIRLRRCEQFHAAFSQADGRFAGGVSAYAGLEWSAQSGVRRSATCQTS